MAAPGWEVLLLLLLLEEGGVISVSADSRPPSGPLLLLLCLLQWQRQRWLPSVRRQGVLLLLLGKDGAVRGQARAVIPAAADGGRELRPPLLLVVIHGVRGGGQRTAAGSARHAPRRHRGDQVLRVELRVGELIEGLCGSGGSGADLQGKNREEVWGSWCRRLSPILWEEVGHAPYNRYLWYCMYGMQYTYRRTTHTTCLRE